MHIGRFLAAVKANTSSDTVTHGRLRRIIYTGFGLKGRNVVLVRSCDVVLFISARLVR